MLVTCGPPAGTNRDTLVAFSRLSGAQLAPGRPKSTCLLTDWDCFSTVNFCRPSCRQTSTLGCLVGFIFTPLGYILKAFVDKSVGRLGRFTRHLYLTTILSANRCLLVPFGLHIHPTWLHFKGLCRQTCWQIEVFVQAPISAHPID